MALTILNNIAALAAENQLNITSNNLNSTLEQLSSGSRINSGADDPAGLAIANGLAANIAALTQSSSNATDGVGELQVADGALSQVTTLLNRAVTLATESATGTVSNSQRTALDSEYQSIKAEIDSIGSTTNFNGGQVFTANTINVFLSDGSTAGSSHIEVATGALSSNGLGLGGQVAAGGTLTQAAGSAAVAATDSVAFAGHTVTAATAATENLTLAASTDNFANNEQVVVGGTTYSFTNNVDGNGHIIGGGTQNQIAIGSSGQASLDNLAAAINGTSAGQGLVYGNGTVANTLATAGTATATTLAITASINGLGSGSGATGTGNNVVTTTNAVNASFVGGTLNSGTAGVAGDTVAVGGQTYTFVTHLSSNPTANEVIGITGGTTGNLTTDVANLVAAITNGSQTVTSGVGSQYSVSTVKNANVTAAVDSTPTKADFTASTAGASGNFIGGSVSTAGGYGFATPYLSGGQAAGTAPSAQAGDTVTVGSQTYSFVNTIGNPTGNQIQVLLGSTDSASLQNLADAINGGSGAGASYAYGSTATANTSATATTGQTASGLETLTLTATTKGAGGNSVISGSTGSANTFGAADLSGGASGQSNDLLTQSDAQSALTLINSAVATIAELRGNIGATVNRLQSASNVISNQTQNLTSAENDVTAANIPSAVANLSQYSILEQTGISALAQANQQSQLVLKLLQ